ncbi:MAG: hypothetical protein FWE79_00980 [Firmicutes bacterium]|nr:hypothetical protein [Bacillota bacterium]
MTHIKNISNFLFLHFVLLLFSIFVFNFYLGFSGWSILFSAVATILSSFLIHFINTKILHKKKLKLEEQKEMEAMREEFLIMPSSKLRETFSKLVLEPYVYYSFKPFDEESFYNLIRYLNLRETKNASLFVNKIDKDVLGKLKTVEGLDITVYDTKEIYALLKDLDDLPTTTLRYIGKTRLSLKQFLKHALKHHKAKNYFFFGTLLMFTSFFTPFGLYYLIVGGISLILAIACIVVNDD